VRLLERGGSYLRVCDPSWQNPPDTSYSKAAGGRWNAPGRFGALYLNATVEVASANARLNYESEIATLFDLRPEYRPGLQLVEVASVMFVDVVTPEGVRSLRLPTTYPRVVTWNRTQPIAARAYDAGQRGIACRSAALPSGEELAVFDRAVSTLVVPGARIGFAQWYAVVR
jgi:RES domain-containing protein